jgi:hypothetical protein
MMNRVLVASAVLGCVVTAAAVSLMSSQPAQAFTPPLAPLQGVAAVGPAYLDSFKVTCGATATVIRPPAGPVQAVKCNAPESVETGANVFVGWGDSGIADPAFATRNSPVICGSGCAETSFTANGRLAYCRADTGTVDLFCVGLVAVDSSQIP